MRKNKEQIWVMILRLALAGLFIFSGFTKAVDPIAWGIKMDEYFTSFGMNFMHPYSFYIGFIPTIAEMVLGFMLLFRIRVKLTTIGYLLFMTFFFFLTLWLAIAEHLEVHYGYHLGVVKDCGCFGQAIKMSNLQTFLKNVVIIIPTLILFFKRKSIPDIRLTVFGQWLFASFWVALVFAFEIYCLFNLPIKDYTNWKKGENITQWFIDQPAQKEIVFLYKNNVDSTKLVTLTENQMMTITDQNPNFYSEYEYVDRKDSIIKKAIPPKIPGFSMLDTLGRDYASQLITDKSVVYLLFIHNLDEVNPKGIQSKALLSLVSECEKQNIPFVAVTNSSEAEIDKFITEYKITFPIYFNPIDPVKGPFMVRDAVRSNPGLILIKNGVVVNKWSWRNFPEKL
jgi:triosephosphate isomerase